MIFRPSLNCVDWGGDIVPMDRSKAGEAAGGRQQAAGGRRRRRRRRTCTSSSLSSSSTSASPGGGMSSMLGGSMTCSSIGSPASLLPAGKGERACKLPMSIVARLRGAGESSKRGMGAGGRSPANGRHPSVELGRCILVLAVLISLQNAPLQLKLCYLGSCAPLPELCPRPLSPLGQRPSSACGKSGMPQLGVAALAALLLLSSGAAAVRPAGGASLHAEPASGGENWKRPWFCHDLECPPYTVVNVTDDYEARRAAREPALPEAAAAARRRLTPNLQPPASPLQPARCATTRPACGSALTWRPTPTRSPPTPASG